jgi:membrane protein YdbS with pleckstrin-like domain
MKFPIIIKQSPLILIKRIFAVEILLGIILFTLSFSVDLANYHQLYSESTIGTIFRYSFFLITGASVVQLLVIFFVFLAWNNEEYRLKEKELVHRRGLVFTHERSLLLKNISSVEYKRGVFEFLFGYGTIILHNGGGVADSTMKIRSVETPEIYADIIKDAVDLALGSKKVSVKKTSLLDLILEGEHSRLEFKQTFRYDGKAKDVSKVLEKSAMKTVCAFLNSDGGSLIMGITDNGKVYGMEDDYHTLVRKSRDGFENHFNQVLKNMMGANFRQYITISFQAIEDKDVCLVEVDPSDKPAYLKANGDEEFFIRTGNTTSQLKISEVNSYIETHWKK